ncbi:MAG: TRAP transporter large permease subunit [Rubrimonas sp.]
MDHGMIGVAMLGVFIVVIMLGFPIAFTLVALSVIFGYVAIGDAIFPLFVQRAYGVMSNDVLIAVPLFLFMGYVVERANVLGKLFEAIQLAARNLPGSMAVATLITCALFATATGIVGAVVTLMGLLALPAMLKAGYDKQLAAGVICAGGTLGILIPPSIMLILYGAMAGESIVRLYAAALIPGFMLAGLYMLYVIGRAMIQPSVAPRPVYTAEQVRPVVVYTKLATSFLPLFVLIAAVLGAILFGLATPHEAAGIGALGGILLGIAYGGLTFSGFKDSVYLTIRASAMVCWLFVGSWIFASVFSLLGGERVVADFMRGMDLTPLQFLLLTQLIIFLLGWPLEWTEIIVIFVPIFLPLLPLYGIDPILFGVLVALNIQTSFLTPPMAMSAFYLKGIAGRSIELGEIFRGIIPFLVMVIISMVLFHSFPVLGTWLPQAIYGR